MFICIRSHHFIYHTGIEALCRPRNGHETWAHAFTEASIHALSRAGRPRRLPVWPDPRSATEPCCRDRPPCRKPQQRPRSAAASAATAAARAAPARHAACWAASPGAAAVGLPRAVRWAGRRWQVCRYHGQPAEWLHPASTQPERGAARRRMTGWLTHWLAADLNVTSSRQLPAGHSGPLQTPTLPAL